MATDQTKSLSIALFSELFMSDQLARNLIGRALPRGMELSHWSVLTHLSRVNAERTPAQLAKAFHVTRGAMTNTINKLERAGHIHIRPDWDDARRKWVAISPAGRRSCDLAFEAIAPVVAEVVEQIGPDKVRAALPVLREMRQHLDTSETR